MSAARFQAQITTLLESGVLQYSSCSKSILRELRPLLDAGIVVEERAGGGRRLAVLNSIALGEFVARRFPEVELPQGTFGRVTALARYRDTKALPADTPEIVMLRAWSDSLVYQDDKVVPAAGFTRQHGVFSFALGPHASYELRGACALVENPAVLLAFEPLRTVARVEGALYGAGRLSGRLIQWLCAQTSGDFRLVHFPDYDPVGLSEFERLRKSLGQRVALHIPSDLDKLFEKFGNRNLLDKVSNQALLPKLRASQSPEIDAVLNLIEYHNAGLEQECLLF
jgi:hypothetical protein